MRKQGAMRGVRCDRPRLLSLAASFACVLACLAGIAAVSSFSTHPPSHPPSPPPQCAIKWLNWEEENCTSANQVDAASVREAIASDNYESMPSCACAFFADMAASMNTSIVYGAPGQSVLNATAPNGTAYQFSCFEGGCDVATNEFGILTESSESVAGFYVTPKDMSSDPNVQLPPGS
jgi:hypothetical protein